MAIITMSRQIAALGDELARELAQLTRYRFIDKQTITTRLEAHGIGLAQRERYDERKPSLWEARAHERDDYLHFLKTVLYEYAADGDCIIVGRGAVCLFARIPGALHVRVAAPRSVRIGRIMSYLHCDEKRAEQVITQSDHDRRGFHRHFFDADWDDATRYELEVNTGAMTPVVAARMVVALRDALVTPELELEGKRQLADRVLAQRVVTRIHYEQKIGVHLLDATCDGGDVCLHGVTSFPSEVEAAVAAAEAVPGVKRVRSDIPVVPEYSVFQ